MIKRISTLISCCLFLLLLGLTACGGGGGGGGISSSSADGFGSDPWSENAGADGDAQSSDSNPWDGDSDRDRNEGNPWTDDGPSGSDGNPWDTDESGEVREDGAVCEDGDCESWSDEDTPTVSRDCLDFAGAAGGFSICGEWRVDSGQRYSGSGDMRVTTPIGEFDLLDVNLVVDLGRNELYGDAAVPFPKLGFLGDATTDGPPPRANVTLAHGSSLRTIWVNGAAIDTNPSVYYLIFDYMNEGLSVGFGDVGISRPSQGSTLVVAPEEPMVFIGGDIAGLLTGGLVDDAAIGFSLDGRMPYETQNELFDGHGWRYFDIEGHLYLQGGVQIGAYPVYVNIAAMLDVDADGDGTTVFEGDGNDVALAGDGTVSLGYSKAGFDLTLEMGEATVFYDGQAGPVGELYVYGESGFSPFDGTPLETFDFSSRQEVYGYFRDTDDFLLNVTAYDAARVGPFELRELGAELRDDGVSMFGQIEIPGGIGEASLSGEVYSDGDFLLTGTADLSPGDLELANADLTLTPDGLGCSARVDLPGLGHGDVSGQIEANGDFEFSGSASIEPAGFEVANATCTLTPRRATVAGRVELPGVGDIDVRGEVEQRGRFSLTGEGTLAPGGFTMTNSSVTITERSAEVAGRIALPGVGGVQVSGEVSSNGRFRLTGVGELRPLGLRIGSAQVTVTENSATVVGEVNIFGRGGVDIDGYVQSQGSFRLTGEINVNLELIRGEIAVTISQSGASGRFSGSLCLPTTNECVRLVSASVSSNGEVCAEIGLVSHCERI